MNLSEQAVVEILTCGGSQAAAAKRFGVSQVTVQRIRAGERYKHIYARVVHGVNVEPKRSRDYRPFDERYEPVTESGCWLWTGVVTPKGYGRFGSGTLAHRATYEARFGKIPAGMYVLHKCDTPPCVNPDHLFLGTIADNIADMVAKNRQAKGAAKKRSAKLSEEGVRIIRESTDTCAVLADRFGVSAAAVCMAKNGKTWAHVAGRAEKTRIVITEAA